MLPRRRQPSPTLKVDRAQPGPDEGKPPKSEKQATLNGSNLHPMWPVSLFGCGPLIRHALRRATFPVGEGDLPAGAFHTLSWERVAGPKALTGVGRTKPTARRSLSPPGADSSLYAREPAPHPSRLTACHLPRGGRLPPAGAFPYLPPGEGQELFTSRRHRERCSPRHSLPDPGSWPGSSRWAPWPPGLWTSPGSCGPDT